MRPPAWPVGRHPLGLLVLATVVVGLGSVLDSSSYAQDLAPPAETKPESYFRLLIPKDRIDNYPTPHFPMKRSEFEKKVAELAGGNSEPNSDRNVRILAGDYTARFDGRQLIGEATLEVQLDGENASFLPLAPANFAVTSATWEDETPRAATIGLSADGEVGVLVETSGHLKLGWSLASQQSETPTFVLKFPEALVNQLDVQTPPNLRLVATGAYVTEKKNVTPSDQASSEQPPAPATRYWHVLLGGKSQTTMTLEAASRPLVTQPMVVWREIAEYDISPSSIECLSTWQLDVSQTPLEEIVIQGDASASLADIRVGNQSLTWSIQTKPSGWTAVAALPEPLWGPARQLVVRTLSTARLGTKQVLPRVRLQEAIWHGSDVTVRIDDSLRLEDILLTPGRIVFASWDARTDQDVRLQAFAEEYKTEVTINRRASRPQLTMATLIQIDALQMNAVVQGEVTAEDPRFSLQAELPRVWVIDSVDTIPADLLEDRLITNLNDATQRIDIRLRRAASREHPLRFVVRAHRRRPPEGESISQKSLRVLEVPNADVQKIIAVDVLDPTAQLLFTGDARLQRLAENDLGEVEQDLLPAPGVLLFRDNEQATELELRLEPRRPRFVANPNVQVTVEPDRVDYVLSARCTPEGAPPRRLMVHLETASSQSIEWQGSANLGDVTARPVVGAGDDQGENWLVEWSRSPTGPFEITARFSRSMEAQQRLPLLSLPEATSQRGVVEIISAHAGLFAIDATQAQPLPTGPPGESTSRVRMRLRYEPTSRDAIVMRSLLPSETLPPLRCEEARLVSRVGMDGSALHELNLNLMNEGGGSLRFRLPDASLLKALVDGRELELEVATDDAADEQWYLATLPHDRRVVHIELTYNTTAQSGRLSPFARWNFPLPVLDLPLGRREWEMWIPPGINLVSDIASPGSASRSASEAGWRVHSLRWPETGSATIGITRPTGMAALTFGVMFLVAGLLFVCRIAGQGWTIPLLLIFAASLWLVPPQWEWLFSGIVWGMLISYLIVVMLKLQRPQVTAPHANPSRGSGNPSTVIQIGPRTSSLTGSGISLGIAVCLIGSSCWPLLWAQEPTGTPGLANGESSAPAKPKNEASADLPPAAGPIQPPNPGKAPVTEKEKPFFVVLDPIDENNKPVDDYVFVSPTFLALLNADQHSGVTNRVDWLLHSADYRAIFRSTTQPEPACHLSSVEAVWEINVLRDNAQITLPLHPDEFDLLGGSLLDNTAITLQWKAGEPGISLKIAQPGRHQLRMQLRPHMEDLPTGRRVKFAIPPTLVNRLTVEGSALVPAIDCQAGDFHWLRRQGEAEASFPFGMADRLEFNWQTTSDDQPTTFVGEQLAWWKLRPNSITVDAQFRLRPTQGKLSSFLIEADPRLRPMALEGGLKAQPVSANEQARMWRFDLPQPTDREVVLPIQFQLMGVTPIGRFSPPRLLLHAERIDRQWAAISTSDDLQLTPSKIDLPDENATLAGTEFLASWRDITAPVPAAAFQSTTLWCVDVQPLPQPLTVSERTSLTIAREHQRIRYEAQIADADNDFLHRLLIPPTLELTSIHVQQGDEEVPCEWKLKKKGVLTLMVARSMSTGTRTIVLDGTLPPFADGPLPWIRLADAEVARCDLEIFAGENVSLEVHPANGWQADASEPGEFVSDWGRVVGRWSAAALPKTGDQSPGTAKLTSIDAQVNGSLEIQVVREADGWYANTQLDFNVTSGALDHLRLEIPREWNPTPADDSDLHLETRDIPGQLRQQLLIRPAVAWRGKQSVMLHGPLATGADGFRAPDVRVLEQSSWQRRLVLPTQFDQQKIQWSVSGLQEIGRVESSAESETAGKDRFLIPGARFVAVVETIQHATRDPVALLAEAHLWEQSATNAHGLVMFELIPNGRSTCSLRVPEHLQLAQITVNGQAAVCHSSDVQTWQVELESTDLPQLVAVAFDWQLPADGVSDRKFELPDLIQVPVEQTIWVIHSAMPNSSMSADEKLTGTVPPSDQRSPAATALFKSQSSVLQTALQSDFPTKWPDLMGDWLLWRQQHWKVLAHDWQVAIGAKVDLAQQTLIDETTRRFAAAEKQFPPAGERPAANDVWTSLPFDFQLEPQDRVLLFDHWHGSEQLPAVPAVSSKLGAHREFWGSCLLMMALIAAVVLSRFSLAAQLSAHPVWLLAVAGVLSLLTPTPSWIGWGLLGFAALAMLREQWARRRSKRTFSMVSTTRGSTFTSV